MFEIAQKQITNKTWLALTGIMVTVNLIHIGDELS
jgi:hypothetical protein